MYFFLSFEFLYEQNIPKNNMGLTCYKSSLFNDNMCH